MIYRNLPACFHPTTVLVLDDDAEFVDHLTTRLELEYKVKAFTSPKDALEFAEKYQRHSFTDICISQPESKFEERDIQVDMTKIPQYVNNAKRGEEISCLIVDFAMPYMTGSEFCSKIKNTPFKKLMLTAEATDKEGINAFNMNLIDQFYNKGKATVGDDIVVHIKELQIAYFQELSSVILKSLIDSPNPPPHSLLDPDLVEPIFKLLEEGGIVEYYLYSNEGYFKTYDKEGNEGWMTIHSDDEIDTLEDLISHLYSDMPSKALKKVWDDLKDRKITLLFPTVKDSNTDPNDWEPYICETFKLTTSKTDYYVSFKHCTDVLDDFMKDRDNRIEGEKDLF